MKGFIYLLAGFVFFSMSGWANQSNETLNIANGWNTSASSSYIFTENGIEFSVFRDGQFDFYLPQVVNTFYVGNDNINFSFNTGYNYNPYVQYDSYGAIIQIRNTPIFYDYFGRIQQIGNVFITYNRRGFINRIGGLNLYYRGNAVWRQTGFINLSHRNFVWRPWHNYYALPAAQFYLISTVPYRRFYSPVRHIYYRPYRNNSRQFTFNRQVPNVRSRSHVSRHRSYAQSPRNSTERNLRSSALRQIDRAYQTRRNLTGRSIERKANSASRTVAERSTPRAPETRSRLQNTSDRTHNTRTGNEVAQRNSRSIATNSRISSRSDKFNERGSSRISTSRANRSSQKMKPSRRSTSTNQARVSSRKIQTSESARKSGSRESKPSRSSRNRR